MNVSSPINLYLADGPHGKERSFTEILRLLCEAARQNPSHAWKLTLCSGASWFAGFFSEQVYARIQNTSDLCITGSGDQGALSGDACRYLLSGKWRFASGAPHATHFTVNAVLTAPIRSSVGSKFSQGQVLSVIVPANKVRIGEPASFPGMRESDTCSFEIDRQEIFEEDIFQIDTKALRKVNAGQFSFKALAWATLSVNLTGMTLRLCDLFNAQGSYIDGLAQREKRMGGDLRLFYDQISELENELFQAIISPDQANSTIVRMSENLATDSRRLFFECLREFPASGPETDDIRILILDFKTALSHAIFRFLP